MAITEVTYTPYNNGDERLAIRNKLNTLGSDVANLSTEIPIEFGSYVAKDGSTLQTLVRLAPQTVAPTHYESQVYYDDTEKSLTVHTDIPNFNHNLGQETVLRVINKTGVTITNGQVLTYDGTDALTSRTRVKLAIADNFANSQVIGVATHDMPNDTEGFITNFGLVNDVDTDGLNVGVPIFLSDTVAGGMTNDAPDIITRVGGIIVSDATIGKIFAYPKSNMELPTVFAYMQGQTLGAESYSLTTSPQAINDYNVEDGVVMSKDKLAGTISIGVSGSYELSVIINISTTSTQSTRAIQYDLYDGVAARFSYTEDIQKDSTGVTSSFTFPFAATAGEVMSLNISADTNMDVDIDNISFSIKSLDIR